MSLRFARLLSLRSRTLGVWSDFASRPASLRLHDENSRKDLFEGISDSGPQLLQNSAARQAYHLPELIDDVFLSAYKVLEEDAATKYQQISKEKLLPAELEQKLAAAEELNPEVLHNVTFHSDKVDRAQPVYRRYLRKQWEEHDLMVTMQRLEQLHVIPDTLPTLDPRVDVKVKFGHNTNREFIDWVTPGDVLPAFAVSKPPTIQIQEFETVEGASGLYTVLLVNPDVPDLAANSYKCSLNYGLHNVPLTFADNTITPGKLLANPQWVFQQYEPLVPEKNIPTQRACLWVFRQPAELKDVSVSDNFDIRDFAETHKLEAVGAHVWRQAFDRSVNKVRQEYGLPEGTVYHRVRGTTPLL